MDLGLVWVVSIILAVAIEAFTRKLLAFWVIPGAITCVIMNFFSVDYYVQFIVFIIILLSGISGTVILKKHIKSRSFTTNIDTIVGEKCVVTEKIDNFAGCGEAKAKGCIWSARGVLEDDIFEVGEVLTVVAIEGVKLICKK